MASKIAVAILHGIGNTPPDFAEGMRGALTRRYVRGGGRADDLAIEPVWWSPVLESREERLLDRVEAGDGLRYRFLRQFLMESAGDAVAYQPTPTDRHVYDGIHAVLAATLRKLADRAGPDAPLVIVAHSLGTVIASNYVYDVQTEQGHVKHARKDPERPLIAEPVRREMRETPLERLETLSHLVTMGSPIALWSLRYRSADPAKEYGVPITVPSPLLDPRLAAAGAGWTNVYDRDDVIGSPLRPINEAYRRAVREDVAVDVGGPLTSWNPASHGHYWTDPRVNDLIARQLVALRRAMGPP
ncbi:MAG: hypothetical protein QOE90_104 [Thermoplasmata archaeon]|jgi:hypothetical protein|nr:hypothetical protein [Thermoplasmata archaeon]